MVISKHDSREYGHDMFRIEADFGPGVVFENLPPKAGTWGVAVIPIEDTDEIDDDVRGGVFRYMEIHAHDEYTWAEIRQKDGTTRRASLDLRTYFVVRHAAERETNERWGEELGA